MDSRVRYTKNMIARSLLQLLRQKPFDKITVSDICRLAEINRSTFYRYYRDVYDLMEQLIRTTLEDILLELERMDEHLENKIRYIFATLYRYKDIWILLRDQQVFQKISLNIFDFFAKAQPASAEPNGRSPLFYFIFYGYNGLFKYWLNHNMQETPEEISDYAVALFRKLYP